MYSFILISHLLQAVKVNLEDVNDRISVKALIFL